MMSRYGSAAGSRCATAIVALMLVSLQATAPVQSRLHPCRSNDKHARAKAEESHATRKIGVLGSKNSPSPSPSDWSGSLLN